MGISTSQISQYIIDLQQDLKEPVSDVGNLNRNDTDRTLSLDMTAGGRGIFADVRAAIQAAAIAQRNLMEYTLEDRGRFIDAMRGAARANARKLAEIAYEET